MMSDKEGSNGDLWWAPFFCLVQVNSALGINALFVFNQSSAHASLLPDALKGFIMSKTNNRGNQSWCINR